MASITLQGGAERWGVGVVVGAYRLANWSQGQRPPSGAPLGAADGTAIVQADGSVPFSGLADATQYVAVEQSGGSYHYLSFQTDALSSGGGSFSGDATSIRGKNIPSPGAPENGKGWVYDDATDAMVWTDMATQAELDAHAALTNNPHAVTKAQVGLGSADNTADTAKPVSTAQQTALDAKQPLDADLTSIAALTTAAKGRGLLELATAAALEAVRRNAADTGWETFDPATQAELDARSPLLLKPPFAAGAAASNAVLNTAAKRALTRWVARKTGTITKLHHAAVVTPGSGAGYAGGDTGLWEVTTYTVNPDGTPNAVVRQETGIVPGTRVVSGVGYVDMTKNGGATPGALAVTKGDEFITVWRNSAAAPTVDYASVNNFWNDDGAPAILGVHGAQARNERDPLATDVFYGMDPREVLGCSTDSGATWLIPGYNTAARTRTIPTLVQEYGDGTKHGQPYYSTTRSILTDQTTQTVIYNIRRAQVFTHIGAYVLGYSAAHTPNGKGVGGTPVFVEVNGVLVASAFLDGHAGFNFGSLRRSLSVTNGDVVRLTFRHDTQGIDGCAFSAQYTDMNTLLGTGTSYEWYLSGNAAYVIPVWPLPYLKVTD